MPDQIICDIQMSSTRFFIICNGEVSAYSNEGFTLGDVQQQLNRYINTTGIRKVHIYGFEPYINPIVHTLSTVNNLELEVN